MLTLRVSDNVNKLDPSCWQLFLVETKGISVPFECLTFRKTTIFITGLTFRDVFTFLM